MIGGGAVLFAASGLAGTAILPLLGDIQMSVFTQNKFSGASGLGGLVGLGGAAMARNSCVAPFCRLDLCNSMDGTKLFPYQFNIWIRL